MQPIQETFSTPRRALDVEDYIDILRRHRTWIVAPAFAALVISVVVAFFWPDTYVSTAAIRYVPAQVPERFVASNVNTQIDQRISAMADTITSRGRLSDMINMFNLYPGKRNRVPTEDLVEDMRKDIEIRPVFSLRTSGAGAASTATLQIRFAYQDRFLAQRVVREMVTRFLNDSVSSRESQSVMTTQFLSDQVAMARKDLDVIENRLTQYKLRFSGRLPDQLNSNLQQLRTLEARLGSVGTSISRVSQDKLGLESQLRILREQQQALASAPESSMENVAKNERLVQLERNIMALESTIAGLREQYKEAHPDIRRAQAQLAALTGSRDRLIAEDKKQAAAAPKKDPPSLANTPQLRELEANIQRTQSLIEAKDLELEQYVKEQAQIDQLIRQYQARIEASPLAEREYAELTREYNLAKQRYDDLSMKKAQSEVATDLESRKQGETLELLDHASLPQTPTEPKRWLIISIGTALGLMLGLFLAGGREMKDTSLKNLKDVRAYTRLPVLGSIPLLENDMVVRRKRRLAWLAWSGAAIVGVLAMVGSVYYYYYSKGA